MKIATKIKIRNAVSAAVKPIVKRHLLNGFSVLELMVVVAIGAILLGIGAPSFTQMINNFRLTSASSQLFSDFAQGRNEAIKRNTRVLVCVANNTGTDCGTVTNWQSGWLVCVDADADSACDAGIDALDGSPNLINARPVVNAQLRLNGTAAVIVFNPNGTQGVAGQPNQTLTFTGTWTGARASVLSISAIGKISKS